MNATDTGGPAPSGPKSAEARASAGGAAAPFRVEAERESAERILRPVWRAWLGRWGLSVASLVVALVITARTHYFFIRPFATPVNMDEGYCSALALRMFQGHWLPYVDGVSQRGPVLYWLYALTLKLGGTFSWTAVRVTGMLLGLATVLLTFALAARLFSPLAGGIAALVATYFVTYELAPWDGVGFNGESTAVPFALGAALIVAILQRDDPPRRGRMLFFAGLLMALAGLSKQMFLIQGVPIGLWILLGPQKAREMSWRERWRELGIFAGGFAVPYALVIALYAATGHLDVFIYYYQRYGREIFMAPVTVEFIRDKIREQIDRYYIGIAGVSALWFYAVSRALRETMTPQSEDTCRADEPSVRLPIAPELHVLLNIVVPGLGIVLLPRRRALGAVILAVAAGALGLGVALRARAGFYYPLAAMVRDAAIWLALGMASAALCAGLIVRDCEGLRWRGLERLRAHASPWYAILQMVCAFVGACFTFRFFPHYFVQFFPFAAVVIAGVVAAPFERLDADDRPGLASAFTVVLGGAILLAIANSALQRNVRMRREVDRWYQEPTADPIVRYVLERTTPDQKIFVWGFRAETYLSSRRFPGSRFVYTVYPAGVVPWFQATHEEEEQRVVPGSRVQLLEDLEREQPELVIDAGRSMNGRYMYNYPMLRAYLDRHYCFMRYVDGEPVYRRRHGERCPPADY